MKKIARIISIFMLLSIVLSITALATNTVAEVAELEESTAPTPLGDLSDPDNLAELAVLLDLDEAELLALSNLASAFENQKLEMRLEDLGEIGPRMFGPATPVTNIRISGFYWDNCPRTGRIRIFVCAQVTGYGNPPTASLTDPRGWTSSLRPTHTTMVGRPIVTGFRYYYQMFYFDNALHGQYIFRFSITSSNFPWNTMSAMTSFVW